MDVNEFCNGRNDTGYDYPNDCRYAKYGSSFVTFWGIMSLASLLGGLLAIPVNWWMVKNKLKHGMGKERALGKG
ncbi:DUF4396 domain-containing protein, partial [Mucilaginibacter sp. 5B2]|nr:DUF4396 domain-containing protein [Mucilaginibacter sp. 5B2]